MAAVWAGAILALIAFIGDIVTLACGLPPGAMVWVTVLIAVGRASMADNPRDRNDWQTVACAPVDRKSMSAAEKKEADYLRMVCRMPNSMRWMHC